MIKYYLSLTLRNFRRAIVPNLISVFGLASGFVCVFFISVWVGNELTYDRFHEDSSNIYVMTARVIGDSDFRPRSPFLSPQSEIYHGYPEVKAFSTTVHLENSNISNGNDFYNSNGLASSLSFFDIFDFPLLNGTVEQYTDSSKVIFLTESMSIKLFGNIDVLGNVVTLRFINTYDLVVGGIISDPPANSSHQFDFIIPFFVERSWPKIPRDYLQLFPGTKIDVLNRKISTVGHNLVSGANKYECSLFPFSDIYFGSDFSEFRHGNINYVLVLIALGFVILIATVVNHINLASSQLSLRFKEFSIRMLMGSRINDLYKQMILDTLFTAVIAVLLSTIMVKLLSPSFYSIVENEMPLSFLGTENGIVYLILVLLIISLVCGSLLARFFSRTKPILSNHSDNLKLTSFKGKLMIIQLIVATTGLILTISLDMQLDYMIGMDPGYDKENIVKISLSSMGPRNVVQENVDYVDNVLSNTSYILSFDRGSFPTEVSLFPWQIVAGQEAVNVNMLAVGRNFFDLFGISVVKGDIVNSLAPKALLNEAAVREYKLSDPIGHKISNSSWGEYEVVGIVKDFRFESAGLKVKPLVIVCQPYNTNPVIVKIARGHTPDALALLSNIHKRVQPDREFTYEFFDQEFDSMYRRDLILSKVFSVATIVAIVISIVGLFSLILCFTEEKTKEIGIRKVFGARVTDILGIIGWHFVRKLLGVFIFSSVLSFWLMQKWLNNFEYRIHLTPWIFISAGVIVFTITIATISFQTYMAANQNPVKSLRHI